MQDAPVSITEMGRGEDEPQPGIALCLSGGGYRAMVFHVGVLWRLHQVGVLGRIKRLSSVSGGSITAAVLGMNWGRIDFAARSEGDFVAQLVEPVRRLAGITIDRQAIGLGLLLPGSIGERIEAAYDRHLFGGATLQSLPDTPRFVINAINVQSGALWRFMKPYMRDWRVGEVKAPEIGLAKAVAASSAFPPILSPVELKLDHGAFTPNSGTDLQHPPFTTDVRLADGGVYDNLGLETAWKNYQTILVSDAGGKMQPEERPKRNWASHAYRVLNMVDNQVRSLRKRQVIESFKAGSRSGAYWGIRTDIADYGLADALPCPVARTMALAEISTRLKSLDATTQERLINWGYAVCDAALRRHVDVGLAPGAFPYPKAGV